MIAIEGLQDITSPYSGISGGNTWESWEHRVFFCLLLMQRLPNILIRAMLKWRKPNPTTMGRAGVEKPRL
jgi:hypothetical protein